MFSTDVPEGTYIIDPKTLKTFMFNGKSWVLSTCKSDIITTHNMSPKPYRIEEDTLPPYENPKKNPRGRPRIHKKEQEKKRIPCAYNNFVREAIAKGTYKDLTVQERMRQIAQDWKISKLS